MDGLLRYRAGKEASVWLEKTAWGECNKRCVTMQGLLGYCKDFYSEMGTTGGVWAVE